MESFQIVIYKYATSKSYKIRVYIIHKSDQVIRFKLCAGDRWMIAERRILENKWKITETSFKLTGDIENHQRTLMLIAWEIENYLKPAPPTRIHPKNIGWKKEPE